MTAVSPYSRQCSTQSRNTSDTASTRAGPRRAARGRFSRGAWVPHRPDRLAGAPRRDGGRSVRRARTAPRSPGTLHRFATPTIWSISRYARTGSPPCAGPIAYASSALKRCDENRSFVAVACHGPQPQFRRRPKTTDRYLGTVDDEQLLHRSPGLSCGGGFVTSWRVISCCAPLLIP